MAWEKLAPGVWNSVLLAVPGSLISAMLGSMNGYVLSKWRFPGADVVFTLLLFGMFIPYQGVMIPLVQLLVGLNELTGTQRLYGGMPGLHARAHRLRHPDLHADLPQLLRRRSRTS